MNDEPQFPPYEERDDREAREVRADERNEQASAYDEAREAREVSADERATRDEDRNMEEREERERRADERDQRADERGAAAVTLDAKRFHRDRRLWLAAFVLVVASNIYLFAQVENGADRTASVVRETVVENCQSTSEPLRQGVIEGLRAEIRTAKHAIDPSTNRRERRVTRAENRDRGKTISALTGLPSCGQRFEEIK